VRSEEEEEEEEERVKEEEIPLSFPENSPSKERKKERIGKEKGIRFFTSLSLSGCVVRFTALTVFEAQFKTKARLRRAYRVLSLSLSMRRKKK